MAGIHFLPSEKRLEETLAHHSGEIQFHEKMSGFEVGRLEYAVSILSDVQHMAGCEATAEMMTREIKEVKALILSVMRKMLEEKGEEIRDM